MALKTQGTELFVVDPDDFSVLKVGCVTTINGITASRDQIETTCLDSAARTYEAGMATPGAMTFGINFDPADASHTRLHELYVAGETLEWAVGLSDGTADMTTASTDGFTVPTSRTFILFDGFITDLPFDFSLNAVVSSTVSVQVSGFPTLSVKA
jgi:hypothetical protein